jgi:hypothetical protein
VKTWRDSTQQQRRTNRKKYGYWRSEDNIPVYCSSYYCNCIADDGAHVVIADRKGIYIIPSCRDHNKRSDNRCFQAKSGALSYLLSSCQLDIDYDDKCTINTETKCNNI